MCQVEHTPPNIEFMLGYKKVKFNLEFLPKIGQGGEKLVPSDILLILNITRLEINICNLHQYIVMSMQEYEVMSMSMRFS